MVGEVLAGELLSGGTVDGPGVGSPSKRPSLCLLTDN